MQIVEYRFQFSADVDLAEAEDTLRLSLLAAVGLLGEAAVRDEVSFSVNLEQAELRLTGVEAVVVPVFQIYASLLMHEFGGESTRVAATQVPAAKSNVASRSPSAPRRGDGASPAVHSASHRGWLPRRAGFL